MVAFFPVQLGYAGGMFMLFFGSFLHAYSVRPDDCGF